LDITDITSPLISYPLYIYICGTPFYEWFVVSSFTR